MPDNLKCFNCGKDIPAEMDNALFIAFEGGYGMFVDFAFDGDDKVGNLSNPDDEAERVVICHECAHALANEVTWVWTLLHPRTSHTHKED